MADLAVAAQSRPMPQYANGVALHDVISTSFPTASPMEKLRVYASADYGDRTTDETKTITDAAAKWFADCTTSVQTQIAATGLSGPYHARGVEQAIRAAAAFHSEDLCSTGLNVAVANLRSQAPVGYVPPSGLPSAFTAVPQR